MVLATWDMAVVQTASDSHAVVVHCLADVEACVEIIACF
jgi:hypothetical protein